MSQDNLVKMQCTVEGCKTIGNFTKKNKKTLKNRLELKKFCRNCKKHTLHRETK